ncbi:MAG: hypothetical protein P8Q14_09735, partial [Vicingaceae bacterium]|nr:hypothetical protein [Vicingaceae bacterium]
MKLYQYILIILILGAPAVSAQKISLNVSFNDTVINNTKLLDYQKEVQLPNLKKELSKLLNQLQQKAYLTSTFDSIIIDSSHYHAYIKLGKKYQWTSLTNKNIDEEVLSKIGFRDKLYNNKPFNEKQLKNFFKKIILYY